MSIKSVPRTMVKCVPFLRALCRFDGIDRHIYKMLPNERANTISDLVFRDLKALCGFPGFNPVLVVEEVSW